MIEKKSKMNALCALGVKVISLRLLNKITDMRQKIDKYIQLLIEYNQKLNLISKNEEHQVKDKQIADSLAITELLKPISGQNLLDLGTGGGLPGIPIAISFPKLQATLLDSTKKKIDTLNDIIKKLKLKNLQTITGRIEEIAHKKDFREKFDYVTAKALAELPTLLEYSIPFLKVKGLFFAYKGPNFEEEINKSQNALKILHAKIIKIHKYSLENDLGSRAIIIIEKIAENDKKFPRQVGVPRKKPL